MEIQRSAHAAQQSAAVEFGGDGDRVGWFPARVQIQHGVIDVLVRRTVKVTGPQLLQHVGDGVFTEHHPAEYGLFGGEILRGLATEILGRC